MTEKTFVFMKTGNCWNIEGSETYLHIPFLKNSSIKYLKRIFLTDFGLNLTDENIESLRSHKKSPVVIQGAILS